MGAIKLVLFGGGNSVLYMEGGKVLLYEALENLKKMYDPSR